MYGRPLGNTGVLMKSLIFVNGEKRAFVSLRGLRVEFCKVLLLIGSCASLWKS